MTQVAESEVELLRPSRHSQCELSFLLSGCLQSGNTPVQQKLGFLLFLGELYSITKYNLTRQNVTLLLGDFVTWLLCDLVTWLLRYLVTWLLGDSVPGM